MCMSPHELSSARIEQLIQSLEEDLVDPQFAGERWNNYRRTWEGRRDAYVQLLKDRAEDGTYDTAGVNDQQTHAYR